MPETSKAIPVLMISDDQMLLDRRVMQQAQTLADAGYGVTLLYGLGGSIEDEHKVGSVVVRRHAVPKGKQFGWFRQKLASIIERVESFFHLGSFRWMRRDRAVLKILDRYRPSRFLFMATENSFTASRTLGYATRRNVYDRK